VADVLVVTAGDLGNPVALDVLVVAGDRTLHGPSVPPMPGPVLLTGSRRVTHRLGTRA
jgi:hypothetical protein